MGEEYIQGKKDGFKHQSEAGHKEELASPNLLSAIADKEARHYRFHCTEKKLRIGSDVLFVAEPEKDLVSVFRGNERIGDVDPGSSADLQRIFGQHPVLSNRIPAGVCGGPDMLGFYDAIIRVPRD
jgi:hypothetical protein